MWVLNQVNNNLQIIDFRTTNERQEKTFGINHELDGRFYDLSSGKFSECRQ